ncbi:MAG: tyrosine-protein phosphatase [Microbacterium sp.]|uniref:tyrosine-protein phosphatase n=1 Tax=Microbacterium sp. TaxID=51671 RepID=UPI001AC3118A|nr:tyrosine-protein phosphatase [Microbacterium sp.]MBN9178442.1 tyrosine-protein phosphatase [Microbacterium sp.]
MTARRVEPVDGVFNFRDTGGLPAGTGITRAGVLYRSANLAHVTAAGRTALGALGVRRIVDLRDDDEVAWEPSLVEGLDVEIVRVPLFLGSVASFFERDVTLGELYRSLIDESGDRVVEAVRAILAAQPALVHCTVGKDRTGVVVALLLTAAGVEVDAVVADYAATESSLPPERNARVLTYLRRAHPAARNVDELATRAPAEVMRALLAEIEERHGSVAGYLSAHGLDAGELAALRGILIAT